MNKTYVIAERIDPKKCYPCQADYEFCQNNKCCKFQGIEKDICFMKKEDKNGKL